MQLIYIAHPYGGKQENVNKVQSIILDRALKLTDHTFYSPLHTTGFLYEELSYLDGMEHCFEALSRCDELWLCEGWEKSRGCNLEYAFAKGKGIPIELINN